MLQTWRALPEPDLAAPSTRRWVVVDCETSGLDPRRDRLLALGAVRIEGGLIALEQSFAAGLRQQTASEHANILVHGIGEAAQRSGAQPQGVLADFLRFAGKDVLVGFHAPFDATILRRAMREHLDLRFSSTWLDVEAVARSVFPEAPARGWGLDEWLQHLRIPGPRPAQRAGRRVHHRTAVSGGSGARRAARRAGRPRTAQAGALGAGAMETLLKALLANGATADILDCRPAPTRRARSRENVASVRASCPLSPTAQQSAQGGASSWSYPPSTWSTGTGI